MVLIYSTTSSSRLQYICRYIFKERLGLAYGITRNIEGFADFEGISINYSNDDLTGANIVIRPHALLFEQGINEQHDHCFRFMGMPAFFKTQETGLQFDLFAASFYLLSRYEEYLPHEKDEYGRFAHASSLAGRNDFLKEPVIETWLDYLKKCILSSHPELQLPPPAYRFIPTYDIDIAWSYANKGLKRNLGGFILSPSLERLQVIMGKRKDPFDAYAYLDELHQQFKLSPIYFFLLAGSRSTYDKNIPSSSPALRKLVRQHADLYEVGLHPSWQSGDKPSLVKTEKMELETICSRQINSSRQHYVRLILPVTYRNLISEGITDDYSMGYGSINGFRASTANPFPWYDLEKEEISQLIIHPFCFMDANSFYEQRMDASAAFEELVGYKDTCKRFGGELITVFHNHFLGTEPRFRGWKEMYTEFISQAL